MLEGIKKWWNKFYYGTETPVKQIKVTPRRLQMNISAIDERMKKLNNEINETTKCLDTASKDVDPETGESQYSILKKHLDEQNELYKVMQDELRQEYDTLKKLRESRFYIAPKDGIMIAGVVFMGTFMIALERENPKALKLATFLLKIFPMKL